MLKDKWKKQRKGQKNEWTKNKKPKRQILHSETRGKPSHKPPCE